MGLERSALLKMMVTLLCTCTSVTLAQSTVIHAKRSTTITASGPSKNLVMAIAMELN